MTVTFLATKLTLAMENALYATTFLMIVPSAVTSVVVPAKPVPSLATAYTYPTFLHPSTFLPATLSTYLISKSSAFAVVLFPSSLVMLDRSTFANVCAVPSKSNALSASVLTVPFLSV